MLLLRHRRVRAPAARTSSSRRSGRRSRRWSTPTCSLHVVDALRARRRARRSTPSATVLREIGAGDVPELLVVNKIDVADPTPVDDLLRDAPGAVAVSAATGEGIDKLVDGDRRPAARARRRSSSCRSRTTAATCSPRCTARARCSSRCTTTTAPGSGPGSPRRRGVRRSGEFVGRRPPAIRAPPTVSGPCEPGFVPPPYPHDRLGDAAGGRRARCPGGIVDCSVGTPVDPMPDGRAARRCVGAAPERGRVPAVDRHAGAARGGRGGWIARRFGVAVAAGRRSSRASAPRSSSRRCPHCLSLRDPSRDTVLYPAISYPTYAMGATLAGLPRGPGPARRRVAPRPRRPSPTRTPPGRSLLWLQRPGNPTGVGAPPPGRSRPRSPGPGQRGIVVASDECYVEFTCDDAGASAPRRSPRSPPGSRRRARRPLAVEALEHGRAAGSASSPATRDLVSYLGEVRKHAGMMVPGADPGRGGRRARRRRPRRRAAGPLRERRRGSRSTALRARRPRRTTAGRRRFYLWLRGADGHDDGWDVARPPRRDRHCSSRRATSTAPGGARPRPPRAHASTDDRLALERSAGSRGSTVHGRPRSARDRPRTSGSRRSGSGRDDLAVGRCREAEAPRARPRGDRPARPGRGPGRRGRRRRGRRPPVAEAGDPPAVPARGDGDDRARPVRVPRQDPAEARLRRRRRCGSCPARRPAGARTSRPASS